jgi:DNA-binding transcriptional ArsR family regulator
MGYEQALDALGDPTRRAILDQLRVRPRSVREIADLLPVSRPAVSKHLRVLKQADLVTSRAQGTRRIYRLRPEGFHTAMTYWEEFWHQALTQFKEFAEADRTEGAMHAR